MSLEDKSLEPSSHKLIIAKNTKFKCCLCLDPYPNRYYKLSSTKIYRENIIPLVNETLGVDLQPLVKVSDELGICRTCLKKVQDFNEFQVDSQQTVKFVLEKYKDEFEKSAATVSRRKGGKFKNRGGKLKKKGGKSKENSLDLKQTSLESEDSNETNVVSTETGVDPNETSVDSKEAGVYYNSTSVDLKETSVSLKETSVDTLDSNEASLASKELSIKQNKASVDSKETNIDLKEATIDLKQTNADSKKPIAVALYTEVIDTFVISKVTEGFQYPYSRDEDIGQPDREKRKLDHSIENTLLLKRERVETGNTETPKTYTENTDQPKRKRQKRDRNTVQRSGWPVQTSIETVHSSKLSGPISERTELEGIELSIGQSVSAEDLLEEIMDSE